MIQRLQSLFLLLIAALSAALFLFPVFIVKTTAPVGEMPYLIRSNVLTSIVVAIMGMLSLITIFLYKNRQRQMMLCRLNILLIIASIGLILQASDPTSMLKTAHVEYTFAVYFPLVQVILDWLAIRFIKKDEELIRSADRLR